MFFRSSGQRVSVQRIERAATLLRGRRVRKRRRRTQHFAQARAGRSFLLSLLRRRADLFLHLLGVLVAVLQLVRYRRWNPPFFGLCFVVFFSFFFCLSRNPRQPFGFLLPGVW